MYLFVEFAPDTNTLFHGDEDHRQFMTRAQQLGRRWGIALLAFRMEPDHASFLIRGGDRESGHWCRLLQSGFGVWRRHQGRPLDWQGAARAPLLSEQVARAMVDRLHAEREPLRVRWCSLRDALGLRDAPWFDPGWLLETDGPMTLLARAGGEGLVPTDPGLPTRLRDPWPVIQRAVADATGQAPTSGALRHVCRQVATRRGWTRLALARELCVQMPTIHRSLRQPEQPALRRALILLNDPTLRASLYAAVEGRAVVAGASNGRTQAR